MLGGAALIIYIMFRWFGQVIGESESGKYNAQVDISYRWSMAWFIFSEVMFFAAFFGALFYLRQIAGPVIGAVEILWPVYDFVWPTSGPAGAAFTAACLRRRRPSSSRSSSAGRFAEKTGWPTGELFMTVRVATTGRAASPPLFETLAVLGKENCRRRLRRAAEVLKTGAAAR